MLVLVRLKNNDINGWIIAQDKADLLHHLKNITESDNEDSDTKAIVSTIIKQVESLPEYIPYGKHYLQIPGVYLLASF